MTRLLTIIFLVLGILSPVFSQLYRGGELRTIENYTYGRFEVSFKAANGDGLLSTFFTYNTYEKCCAEWNEIDFEILGRYKDDIQATTITPNQYTYNSHSFSEFDPRKDFHTYAFEWTPEYVAWFVDGEEFYRQTGEHIATLVLGQKIMMNIWMPAFDDWVGSFDKAVVPVFAYYDWVSYYAYTPGEGDYGSDNNFTLQWRDDFDSWNQERWEKSDDHGWPGNDLLIIEENVVFKDGMMILCLTDPENTGYVDKVAPSVLWARSSGTKLTAYFSEEVDTISANEPSNYSIPGATINDVHLLDDQQTIEFEVSELDTSKFYQLVVFGLTDQFSPPNTRVYSSKQIIHAQPLSFPIKINVGGDAIYNGEFLPDQLWSPEVEYGRMDGTINTQDTSFEITNTDLDELYLSSVWELVKYKIRVPDGVYDITLHFSEYFFSEPGNRLFGVSIENDHIVKNLDLAEIAGLNTAYDITASQIEVNDGIIDIHFNNWYNYPLLCGITVNRVSTGLDAQALKPAEFRLKQNYPNPFNPQTKIEFSLAEASHVKIQVFNAAGQAITDLINSRKKQGLHSINFDGGQLSSGIYYYRLTANGNKKSYSETRKMLLLK